MTYPAANTPMQPTAAPVEQSGDRFYAVRVRTAERNDPMAYGAKYRSEYLDAEAARERQQREWDDANEAAGKQRRARQAAEGRARDEEREAAFAAAITPEMAAAEREWLLAHPGGDVAGVRPLLRATIVEARERAMRDAETARLLRSGRYSM